MDKLIDWAIELQALAQNGSAYSKDKFDIERFNRIRDISAEMITQMSDLEFKKVKDLFCCESGYQTPKMDTRAVVFKDNKLLMVQEHDGRWTLPGGWIDVNSSIRANTIKETKEEAGLDVKPVRLIALNDRKVQQMPPLAFGICKVFVLCELLGGEFKDNIETQGIGFFGVGELPSPIAEEKTSLNQLKMCFEAARNPNWQVVFD